MARKLFAELLAQQTPLSELVAPDGTRFDRQVLGFSGGKDSVAMAALRRRLGPTTLLHAVTGWEYPGHEEYLDYVADAQSRWLAESGNPQGRRVGSDSSRWQAGTVAHRRSPGVSVCVMGDV